MDERFPTLPMLKCDHLMLSPPMFCHALPASSGSSVKLLLGSHNSQEITMLQYSGQSIGGVSSSRTHSEAKMLNMDKVLVQRHDHEKNIPPDGTSEPFLYFKMEVWEY